jgi:hypothetical protein
MIERVLAAAAVLVLPLVLRVLPLRTTLALCDAWPRSPAPHALPATLARRIDRWMRHGRSLWRPTCLTRAVILYAMLRQHGYAPAFHIGTHGAATSFHAHAWTSLGGLPIGEPPAPPVVYDLLVRHGA